ncbi:hypothetical protein ACFLWN_00030 [Chloroflexota bacterium]
MMSQLIEKLRKVAAATPQPIGFRRSAAAKPQMVIIAELSPEIAGEQLSKATGSADAVLYPAPKQTKPDQEGEQPELPWGLRLENEGKPQNGADFVIFPLHSKVTAAPDPEKCGRVIQIDLDLKEGMLKTVNQLPVDAVLAAMGENGFLTWQQLLKLHRLANPLTKPLLLSVTEEVTPEELKAIWEAGIDGIVIKLSSQDSNKIPLLRAAIADFPARSPGQGNKNEALLPYHRERTEEPVEIEEEEE